MTLWQNFKKIAIVLLTGGCVSYTPPSDYIYKEISVPPFVLASWQKVSRSGEPLTVYLEGDGHSFDSRGQATKDPTPRYTTLRDIAFRDSDANVVYLARPCQFVMTKNCNRKYWTDARFAPEVVEAEAEAVRILMKQNNSPETILVGYSGGAMIAALIAVQNPDIKVKKLITIAGLLDHETWTSYHQVPPLAKSLNLKDYQREFSKIPQIHFLAEKDTVVLPQISPVKKQAVIIGGATHSSGWEKLNLKNYK